MTDRDKTALLEDILEIEEGGLTQETRLDDIDDWDSMAALMLINLADLKFKKKLAPAQIKEFVTIGDILAFLG
jgi:acyl carrier protein